MEQPQENKLEVIVQQSGLEQSKAQYILDNFQSYFSIASEWEQKAKSIVVTNAEQKTEMKMAREARLFLRQKRIDIENARKKLKEQSLREGKAIDGIANVLKALIEPIEKHLDEQEHFVENKLAEEQALLRAEEEARLEKERLEKEKFEEEERKRIAEENIKLKAEAEAREKAIQAEREKAEQERKALEAKAKAEAEAREKLENEKREKEEEEAKRILEIENEKKKAEQAPDKQKLKAYAVELGTIELPKLQTDEAKKILDEALICIKKAIELLKE